MTRHFVYRTIVNAVRKGILVEPFTHNDLIKACPELNKNTAMTFLAKHRAGNQNKNSELFERTSNGKYKLIRPLKYYLSI